MVDGANNSTIVQGVWFKFILYHDVSYQYLGNCIYSMFLSPYCLKWKINIVYSKHYNDIVPHEMLFTIELFFNC